jgi:hypothetical protein
MAKKTFAKGVGIGGVLRRQPLSIMAYAYITGTRDMDNTVTWQDAANRFKSRYGISDEEIDTDSLIRECARINQEFISFGL